MSETDFTEAWDNAAVYDIRTLENSTSAPTLLATETGPKLKPGRRIALYGKRGSGKSWLALKMATDFVAGHHAEVAWIDLDRNTASDVRTRLDLLGWWGTQDKISAMDIDGGFTWYMGMKGDPRGIAPAHSWRDLVVIDGAGALLQAVHPGASHSDNGAVQQVEDVVVNPLVECGATVVLIGHTAKNGDGGSMLGSERWESMADYVLHVRTGKPFNKSTAGYATARLTKDRSGDLEEGSDLVKLMFRPGAVPELRDAVDGEGTAPADRLRLAREAVKEAPSDASDRSVAMTLQKRHADGIGGALRTWQDAVAAARK